MCNLFGCVCGPIGLECDDSDDSNSDGDGDGDGGHGRKKPKKPRGPKWYVKIELCIPTLARRISASAEPHSRLQNSGQSYLIFRFRSFLMDAVR